MHRAMLARKGAGVDFTATLKLVMIWMRDVIDNVSGHDIRCPTGNAQEPRAGKAGNGNVNLRRPGYKTECDRE